MTEGIKDLNKWLNDKALNGESTLRLEEPIPAGRHLVMPKDLNPAGSLFGGQLMSWLDEAAALYAMCQLNTKNIVTVAVTDLVFKERIKSGDFVIFEAWNQKVGTTSLTIGINVYVKPVGDTSTQKPYPSLSTSFTFVQVDPTTGQKVPHGKRSEG